MTAASYIFYGWANPLFTLLMFVSTLIDYCCGLIIGLAPVDNKKRRKAGLVAAIISNLSLLGFFKYTGFAMESYNQLFVSLGISGFDRCRC
jgi:alginate O-acetyltransferase complex protein AlgI